ncbi:tetratricopeptide repeat protein [bacterium]|nr:tetratricopeptide repeat protein [bacterium]
MDESLDKALTTTELNRLDLAGLVRFGNQALQAGQYRRAVSLLREAVQRAPFRQDIRELMAAAIEGLSTLPEEPANMTRTELRTQGANIRNVRPVEQRELFEREQGDEPKYPQPRRPVQRRETVNNFDLPIVEERLHRRLEERREHHREENFRRRDEAPDPPATFGFEREPGEIPAAQPPAQPQKTGRPIAFGRRPGAAHRAEPARRPKPAQFTKRHNRGPVSALLLTLFVFVLFLAVAGAGGYYFWNKIKTPGEGEAANPSQSYEAQYETAGNYVKSRQFSLAVDVLQKLPPTPRRDHMLADIYMAQADVSIKSNPPVWESAIDAIGQAVKLWPENADYGIMLGDSYYTLGRKHQQKDPAMGKQNLEKARDAFQAVLEKNPGNLKALLKLGDAAGALGDPVTQANSYKNIIRIDPSSDLADIARRNLQSLGYRQ